MGNNGEVPYYIKRTLITNMLQWEMKKMKKMTIKQQRDLEPVMKNWLDEDELPTLQEIKSFKNYILDYIYIFGKDDFRTNVMPQISNLYFIAIAKAALNDY